MLVRALDGVVSVDALGVPVYVLADALGDVALPSGVPDSTLTVELDDAGRVTARGGLTEGATAHQDLLPALVSALNEEALRLSTSRLLLHAAVAAVGDAAAVLVGDSGSGKTTIAAALVRQGATYLSDEVAAIDLDTGLVLPFPKPLSIKPGARSAFDDPSAEPSYRSRVVRVSAHGRVATAPAMPRHLYVLARGDISGVEIVPLSRGRAAIATAANSSYLSAHGDEALARLAAFLRSVTCFELRYADADAAAAAVIAHVAAG